MTTYAYIPTGRDIWLQLANRLLTQGVVPSIWLGDDRHYDYARRTYPRAEVISLKAANTGLYTTSLPSVGPPDTFIRTKTFDDIQRRFFALANRQDVLGTYRHLEREALFFDLVLSFWRVICHANPDFLLAAESPHSPSQYLLYELCNTSGIPTLWFQSCGMFPVLLAKSDVQSNPRRVPPLPDDEQLQVQRSLIIEQLDAQLSRYTAERHYQDFEPAYMTTMKRRDAFWTATSNRPFQAIVASLLRFARRGAQLAQVRTNLGQGSIAFSGLPRPPRLETTVLHGRLPQAISRGVQSAYQKASRPFSFDAPFVYYPLHFEPERTTNPEGGDFTDQYTAVMELRRLVPDKVTIIVKEHYSQFSPTQNGYLGRSHRYYQAINQLPRIQFVPVDTDQRLLLTESQFVCTIGGTAALEAAALGNRALVLGWPWFKGCPGTVNYSSNTSYETILEAETADIGEIQSYIRELITDYGIPGFVNPSNVRQHIEFAEFLGSETEASWLYTVVATWIHELDSSVLEQSQEQNFEGM